MERVIIGVTFFLGVGLALVAIVALFRRGQAAGGSLELPGIKLTATSASALFLVVGAAMMLSGFTWASTNRQKDNAVREAGEIHAEYVKQAQFSRELAQRAPALVRELSPAQQALLKAGSVRPLSPALEAEVKRQRTLK